MAKLRQLERKHGIVPLERIDHSKLVYRPFSRNFYAEHPEIEALTGD